MLDLLKLRAPNGTGEFSIGRTAGSGIDGAGEAERLMGDEPMELRRLCEIAEGGFMGKASDVGVPGIEATGAGESGGMVALSGTVWGRRGPRSGGAGLLAEIRLLGKSILLTLLCCLRVNSPSLFRKL